MPSYDSTLEEIRNRIDIVDLISQYVTLKRAGQNYKALCPFHTEKTPSFIVSPSKQIFHCFGCGEGGDIFTFLIKHEGMTYKEAVRELAERAGVELRWQRREIDRDERKVILDLNREAVLFFQDCLEKNRKARDYLEDRGINRDAWRIFSIGFAPETGNALMSYLLGRGGKVEQMVKAGLIAKGRRGYYDVFRNRIVFPIFDLRGNVLAFGGRAMDDSMPKYLNSPETPLFNKSRVLYGLNIAKDHIRKMGYALVMEGYIDVITAHLYGFMNSVAPLGTALTEEHGRLIKRFTDEVILVFDSDQAGIIAAKRSASVLFGAGVDVKMLSLPEGEDPDSFLRGQGAEAFRSRLKSPLSIIDFLIKYGRDEKTVARDAIGALSRIPDSLLQGSYVKKLSERLGINEFFLIEELKGMIRRSRKGSGPDTTPGSYRRMPLDEVYIIKLLLQIPQRRREVLETVSPEDFSDDVLRSIFNKMGQGMTESERLLLECNEEEKKGLAKILMMEDFENPEKVLSDCLRRIATRRQKAMLEDIQAQIRDAEQRGDVDRLRLLQIKQNSLLRDRRVI